MTKLLEWLSLAAVIAVIWIAAFTNKILPQFRSEILWTPLLMVVLFGIYSVLTIAYRYNFFIIVNIEVKPLGNHPKKRIFKDIRHKGGGGSI